MRGFSFFRSSLSFQIKIWLESRTGCGSEQTESLPNDLSPEISFARRRFAITRGDCCIWRARDCGVYTRLRSPLITWE
jgi:hypothetical protein